MALNLNNQLCRAQTNGEKPIRFNTVRWLLFTTLQRATVLSRGPSSICPVAKHIIKTVRWMLFAAPARATTLTSAQEHSEGSVNWSSDLTHPFCPRHLGWSAWLFLGRVSKLARGFSFLALRCAAFSCPPFICELHAQTTPQHPAVAISARSLRQLHEPSAPLHFPKKPSAIELNNNAEERLALVWPSHALPW